MSVEVERSEVAGPAGRPPPWRDVRVLRVVAQVVFLVALAAVVLFLANNLLVNMRERSIRTDFGFLDQSAGFALLGTDFSARDSVWAALRVGLRNTIVVAVWGIVLATILGAIVGIARLSTNWLVRKLAGVFVEALRNVPLIVFLFFLYLAILQRLPRIDDALTPGGLFVLSNRGLYTPWAEVADGAGVFQAACALGLVLAVAVGWWRSRRFDATGQPHRRVLWGTGVFLAVAVAAWLATGRPVTLSLPVLDERLVQGGYALGIEHGALLLGLVLYMAAFMAEIVRGSILAVARGQSEAANALGLSPLQRLRYVVLPQALRVAVPPTGNEYINLTKNTALGLAIAFPELLRVTRISISQGQPAPQLLAIMMILYLTLSLALALAVNLFNRRLLRSG